MTTHRTLLVALLLYVALDLALPMMPGAFVFDPDETIESARTGRTSLDAVAPHAAARHLGVVRTNPRPMDLARRPAPVREILMPGRSVVASTPTRSSSAPSLEDPV